MTDIEWEIPSPQELAGADLIEQAISLTDLAQAGEGVDDNDCAK